MDKEQLVKLVREKGVNYSQQLYLWGFFAAFVLLVIFVVRPTLNGYVARQKELEDIIATSEKYQKSIENLSQLQAVLEARRDEFIYLEQAMPLGLHMYELTRDVQMAWLEHIPSKSYGFPSYSVANPSAEANTRVSSAKPYLMPVELEGDFQTLRNIVNASLNQRRLKAVKSMTLEKGSASAGAKMQMRLEIEAYNL